MGADYPEQLVGVQRVFKACSTCSGKIGICNFSYNLFNLVTLTKEYPE